MGRSRMYFLLMLINTNLVSEAVLTCDSSSCAGTEDVVLVQSSRPLPDYSPLTHHPGVLGVCSFLVPSTPPSLAPSAPRPSLAPRYSLCTYVPPCKGSVCPLSLLHPAFIPPLPTRVRNRVLGMQLPHFNWSWYWLQFSPHPLSINQPLIRLRVCKRSGCCSNFPRV